MITICKIYTSELYDIIKNLKSELDYINTIP
jgi:hypothetical protein